MNLGQRDKVMGALPDQIKQIIEANDCLGFTDTIGKHAEEFEALELAVHAILTHHDYFDRWEIDGTGEEISALSVWAADAVTQYRIKPTTNGTHVAYPFTVKGKYQEEGEEDEFTLHLITTEGVFYGDSDEGDDNANTIMYDRNMQLLSNNYFGFTALFEALITNKGILWASEEVRYSQREQCVTPDKITDEIKALLEAVDIEKLSPRELEVYRAFASKYPKHEALMAVINDDDTVGLLGDQLEPIYKQVN